MRKLSANYIFPVSSPPLKNGIIILDENNIVHQIIDTKGDLKEAENIEFYNGVITPGFINTHCHLELSFLKNKITPNSGMTSFVQQIEQKRETSKDIILASIESADSEMQKNGIVAVGDISNNNLSFTAKQKSKLHYHSFIEVFGVKDEVAETKINVAKNLLTELENLNLAGSISPHAPYSISERLFSFIQKNSTNNQITTIHHRESENEEELFLNKSGELFNYLTKINENHLVFLNRYKSSSELIIDKLNKSHKNILVHNTFVDEDSVNMINEKFNDVYWCLCPNSNLHIENKLPQINKIKPNSSNICLGTDSYASNTKLSILEEMKTILQYFNEINFEEVLKWATINGSKALGIENKYGSIEIGKKAGLNLIENFDFEKMNLRKNSTVKVLTKN